MRTARECLIKAVHCELMALTCADPIGRSMMLETAQRWRSLANIAKAPQKRTDDANGPLPSRACQMPERERLEREIGNLRVNRNHRRVDALRSKNTRDRDRADCRLRSAPLSVTECRRR